MKTRMHTFLALAALAGLALLSGRSEARLLAYYPFDTDFTDASGNANDLTIAEGTPTITTTASEFSFGGGALDVNSATSDQAYLDLAVPITFAAGDTWSVAFWARHRPGSDGRVGMIVGDLTSRDFIWIPRDGAVDGLRFRNSANQNADFTSPPAGVEPAGVYHHWVVVADGTGNVEVFYDNGSLGTIARATTFDITSVAQAFNATTQSMNGQIDELFIFNEALDATGVDNLFNDVKDTTAPTLAGSDIVDDQGGSNVDQNNVVTYTVTFSEEINPGTVDASDFGNAGTAPLSIGAISETAPGVFSVAAMPTGAGTLQLEVSAGASILDGWGNALDTNSAIADDTTITVIADSDPPMTSSMNPTAGSTSLRPFDDLTLTFNESVQVDTGNITIHLADGTLVETIDVTAGSVSIVNEEVTINPVADLQPLTAYYVNIDAGAIEDLAGNDFAGIADDTTWAFTTGGLLLAYYPFDSDFTDASGYGNDLTAQAGTDPVITSTAGEFAVGGGALDLDGNDWLNMTSTLNFGASDPWSVSFWGKRGGAAATQDGMVLGVAGTSGNFIWIPDNPSVVQGLRFRNDSGTSADFGGNPDDGAYHHWVVIADGAGNVTVYRDNVELTTLTPAGGTVFTASDVGQAFNQAGQIYLGQIDELYIYNEAISATKIDELFSAGATAEPRITSISLVGTDLWELTLKGAGNTDYEFRSSTTLDFNPGTLVENLTQETPATDPGTIGGTNASLVTTDGSGDATVRMTLSGDPADFVRAQVP